MGLTHAIKSLISTLGNLMPHQLGWLGRFEPGFLFIPDPLSHSLRPGPACWEVSSLRQGRPLAMSMRTFLSCLERMDRDHLGGPQLLLVHLCLDEPFSPWSQPRFSRFLVPAQQNPHLLSQG